MFIENQTVDAPPSEPTQQPAAPPTAARVPWPWVGALAIALAVVAGVVQVVAIVGASAGDFELGIVLGYLSVGLAVVAVLVGIMAIIVRRGRRTGVVGILLGMLANPLVLLAILQFFGGTQP
jgi:uncharacterized membrane protein YhaH (DUF805 family)